METRVPFAAKWVLSSEYGQEKNVLSEISAIIGRLDPLSTRLDDMLTAVAEACLNAFEHGNRLNINLPVRVRMKVDEISYLFHISDEGEGFNSPKREAGSPEGEEEFRGWGLLFIEALADRWSYGRSRGKFYIEMEFKRSG